MRIVSAFRTGPIWLLSPFLLLRVPILGIFQRIGPIAGGLLLGFASEQIRLEVLDLRPGLLQFPLKLFISLKGVGVATLPVADLATQPQDFAPQLQHFLTQLSNDRTQVGIPSSLRLHQRGIHDARNKTTHETMLDQFLTRANRPYGLGEYLPAKSVSCPLRSCLLPISASHSLVGICVSG